VAAKASNGFGGWYGVAETTPKGLGGGSANSISAIEGGRKPPPGPRATPKTQFFFKKKIIIIILPFEGGWTIPKTKNGVAGHPLGLFSYLVFYFIFYFIVFNIYNF
jgi:hypothetical protein